MPFLLPCPSNAWPPHRSASSGSKFTRVETSLPVPQDSAFQFKLSLEPAIATTTDGKQQQLEEIQPAFFGLPVDEGSSSNSKSSSKSTFDPSMADVQVAVESSVNVQSDSQDDASVLKGRVLFVGGNNANNADSSSTQVSGSNKISPDQPFQRLPDAWPLFLYFRIDKESVFQVDGKQLLHVEVTPAEIKEQRSMPPCLMMVFSCCIFRIFPLYSPSQPATDSDNSEWKDQAFEALRSLEKQLHQLSSNSPSTAAWSPCGSSLPSSTVGEAGQKDGGYPTPAGGQSNSFSSHTTNASRSKKLKTIQNEEGDSTANHIKRKAKRRRDALARSQTGMTSVETVLGMPASVCKPEKLLPPKPKFQHLDTQAVVPMTDSAEMHNNPRRSDRMSIRPLLTGIAEDLAAAYGTHAETAEVLQLYQKEIEEQRCNEMDKLLDSFFPSQSKERSRKNRKSRGRDRRKSDQGDSAPAMGTKSAEEVMKEVRRLMVKERALVVDRSSFLQLPMRG